MTMKHFCILLIFSMTAVLSAAAPQPATAKPAHATPDGTAGTSAAAPTSARPATMIPSPMRSIWSSFQRNVANPPTARPAVIPRYTMLA